MRKRIGIITIDDPVNYGNRLQNFAMQEFLKSFKFEVSTIRVVLFRDLYYLWSKDKMYCIKQYLYSYDWLRNIVHKVKGKNVEKIQTKLEKREDRTIAFEKFNLEFINYDSNHIKSEPIKKKLYQKYDYVVTGSDQVWNPIYALPKCAMYLRFVPKRKRVAIAASFGIKKIPQEHLKIVKRYLKGMRYISVREVSGQKIVEELTGRKSELLMDPTLMVPVDTWESIIENSDAKLPEKYVLTYFLGKVSQENKNYIENIARQKQCEIIWMNSKDNQEVYSWGPENFLKAIRGCEAFFTDSFHGCVFALLFRRQFSVFHREGEQLDMFDRIHTLLDKVDLKNQVFIDAKHGMPFIEEFQFEKVDFILAKERGIAKEIISKVLS